MNEPRTSTLVLFSLGHLSYSYTNYLLQRWFTTQSPQITAGSPGFVHSEVVSLNALNKILKTYLLDNLCNNYSERYVLSLQKIQEVSNKRS